MNSRFMWMGFLVALTCAWTTPGQAQRMGTERGNGGELLALVFVAGAQQVAADLREYQANGEFSEVPLDRFQEAIRDTRVDVLDEAILDRFGNEVDARTFEDARRPGFYLIQLQRQRLEALINRGSELGGLIMHEYLHVIGVPDLRYEVSGRYRERLAGLGCYEKMTRGFREDSRLFRLSIDEVDPGAGEQMNLRYAKTAIEVVARKHECRADEVGIGPQAEYRPACRQILPGNDTTRVCYVPASIGFFFVTFDGADGVNVLFNRWD